MVPRLHKRGKSFKETLNYVLHDPKAQSTDRVDWTLTQNLYSHADDAWFEMFETFKAQDALKQAAGVDARGRKNTSPVLHYSLSWAPGQEPTAEHMQQTALSSLKALGLSEHEAVIVGHSDRSHMHLHVVVNTVHPLTGRTADLKFNKLELSRWAEAYEKEHGIFCEIRVQNNDDRRTLKEQRGQEAVDILMAAAAGQYYGDRAPYVPVKDFSPNRREWTQLKAERQKLAIQILDRLTAHNSTFTRAQLAKEINARTRTPQQFTALLAFVEGNPELVRLLPGKDRYSTRSLIKIEAEIATFAEKMSKRSTHVVDGDASRSLSGLTLSGQQTAALEHLLRPTQLSALVGYAGAGKSTMLGAARERWQAAGFTVRGATISGVAAQSLQAGSGIESGTIHRLLWSLQNSKDQLTARDVLVIDEAGMVGSRQMHALLSAAQAAGTKVVLVGDPEQLRAIQAGAAFRAIVERTGAAEITEIRRQRSAWQREATLDLAEGRTARALAAYEDAGHLRGYATKLDAVDDMVRRWAADHNGLTAGQSSIMLAATNATVETLNERARDELRIAGRLGDERMLLSLDEALDRPRTEFELPVAIGDTLMFTRNDYKLGVRNGTLGRIEGFRNSTLLMRIDGPDAPSLEIDLTKYRNFAYGYAMTVHKAQGITVDRAHVMAERNMDRNLAYVALSRQRENVTLYWSQEEFGSRWGLDRVMSRERQKDTTLDYLEPQPAPRRGAAREPGGLNKSVARQFSKAQQAPPKPPEFKPPHWGPDLGPEL